MDWLTKFFVDVWAFVITPASSIPAGLSVFAIILSTTVYVRTERRSPRPRLETESLIDFYVRTDLDENGDPQDYQPMRFEVINRGSGTAYDVRLEVGDHPEVGKRALGALATDMKATASFNWIEIRDAGLVRMTWWDSPKKKQTRLIAYGGEDSTYLMP